MTLMLKEQTCGASESKIESVCQEYQWLVSGNMRPSFILQFISSYSVKLKYDRIFFYSLS